MNNKKSFVVYATWRSYFELLEDPELIRDLLYAIFDLAEGSHTAISSGGALFYARKHSNMCTIR